jgi:hypothetical protein
MTSSDEDILAGRLAELPERSIDRGLSAATRRRARAALSESTSGRARRVFGTVLLPAVLVACAALYAVDGAAFLQRTYVATNR